MTHLVLVGSRTEGDHPIVRTIGKLRLDLGLLSFLVGVYFSHVRDWGSRGDDSPLALRVLKPLRWALRASATHDGY